MTTLTIATLFPAMTDVNGDASNALVLARRAEWAGIGADLVTVEDAQSALAGIRPDIVVVGSTADSAIPELLERLWPLRTALGDWLSAGVGLLAVGTGWEALSESVDVAPGESVKGLGLFPGRAVWRETRMSDDLIVDSTFGRLVGYENHQRAYIASTAATPLGRVIHGHGNADASAARSRLSANTSGSASTSEGMIIGTAIGTHVHGPVLAKNPSLADHMLESAVARVQGESIPLSNPMATAADKLAQAANDSVLRRVRLKNSDVGS